MKNVEKDGRNHTKLAKKHCHICRNQTKNRFSLKSGQNRRQVDEIGKMWTKVDKIIQHCQSCNRNKSEMLYHAFKRK